MKSKVLASFFAVLLLCFTLLPFTTHAQYDSAETIQENEGITVFRAAFKNVATGLIEPVAVGWGTINCVNDG